LAVEPAIAFSLPIDRDGEPLRNWYQ